MEQQARYAKHAEDTLISLIRDGGFTDKELRLFAVWCIREAMKSCEIENDLCTKACDISESYANDKATKDQLEDIRLQLQYYYELHCCDNRTRKENAIFCVIVAAKWACSENISTWIDDLYACPAKQVAGICQLAYEWSCHDGSTADEWVKEIYNLSDIYGA